jgi:hypothetical protein
MAIRKHCTQAEESLTLQQIIVRLKETLNKKDKRIAELEAEVRRLATGRGNDTMMQRKLQESDRRNFDLVRQVDKYRVDLEASKTKIAELEQFRNQIRESESGDILINLTNINTRQRQQLEKLEQLKRQLETENTELKVERLRITQENDQFRMAGFEKDEEIGLLKRRLAEKDSLVQELFQRGNIGNVYKIDTGSNSKKKRVREKKNNREESQDTAASNQLSADEIRRLQEQERGTVGKPSEPLPTGKLPKPKKEKKVKKEKVIIPETIIID